MARRTGWAIAPVLAAAAALLAGCSSVGAASTSEDAGSGTALLPAPSTLSATASAATGSGASAAALPAAATSAATTPPPGRWGQPPPPPSPTSAPPLPWPQPTDEAGTPVVYLTFDDGPSLENTPAVLSALQRYDARATFFVVGQRAWLHPELVRQEVAAGHAVGGHGWRHVRLTELTDAERQAALGGTQALLQDLGAPGRCFRPPFGATDAAVRASAREVGLRQYLWTAETKDWTHESADDTAAKAIAGLEPGAILVFHDGHASGGAESVTVVETVLREIARRGWVAAALPC